MPGLQEIEQQHLDQLDALRHAPAIALARSRHPHAESDGQLRQYFGPQTGQCQPECPRCHPELYEGDAPRPPERHIYQDYADELNNLEESDDPDPADPETNLPEPELSAPHLSPPALTPPEPGQTWTNLDIPEHPEPEFPP